MSQYIYFVRAKTQFSSHTLNLLEQKTGVRTIEEFHCGENDIDPYTDYRHRPKRPIQAHTLFILHCSFYKDPDKEEFDLFLEQGKQFQLIFQFNAYEIAEKKILD